MSSHINEIDLMYDPESIGSPSHLELDYALDKKMLKHVDYLNGKTEIWSTAWPPSLVQHAAPESKIYLTDRFREPFGHFILNYQTRFTTSRRSVRCSYRVSLAYITPTARDERRGTGYMFYCFLLDYGILLMSDHIQTVMSQHVWQKLSKNYYTYLYDVENEELVKEIDDVSIAYRSDDDSEGTMFQIVASNVPLRIS